MNGQEFLDYVKLQAQQLRTADQPSATLAQWTAHHATLRNRLKTSWGGFPSEPCDLQPQLLGGFEREGYRVEKLLLQTRPGIWMTANAYVPQSAGPHPAVLCVHGHWKFAKSHPDVQQRCIGLAKLGFFVLMVDACGAGERAIGKELGEYHGEMVASTLWPTGLTLAGLQVYENMRAIDYLQSRPEVDPHNIGVTGASGGGNQTMYIGAMDERLKCVVPVCSVGTYQAYLGAACCMCEVTPGALSYTEEGAILGLVAPRGLMLISATQDAFQFSVGEGAKSLEFARQIFALYGKPDNATHAIFESGHAYNQPMREKMYGWMTLHLKGLGDGSPIPEPQHTTEDVETLRCFPGNSRPDDFITLPQFAAAEGRRLVEKLSVPTHLEQWQSQEMSRCLALSTLLGPFPQRGELQLETQNIDGGRQLTFFSEPGVRLTAHQQGDSQRQVILLDLTLGQQALTSELAQELLKHDHSVVTVDLRATGELAWKSDTIGRAPDHNTAEWSLWLGRPLLAQWVWDVTRLLDALDAAGVSCDHRTLIGLGPAGLVALVAAALTTRITAVATVGTLASYVTDQPYTGQRLGTLVPGILRDVGDVAHIAATISPRQLVISQPVNGQDQPLELAAAEDLFRPAYAAYALEQAASKLTVTTDNTPAGLIARLQE